MSRRGNFGGGNGNRGNYGGNSGKGHSGGGRDDYKPSNYERSQTEINYNYTYNKSTHYARNDNQIVKLSRSLSNVLRHNALKEGLKIREDGFVKVDDLMDLPRFRGTTFEKIQHVVNENDKKRFTLYEHKSQGGGKTTWWIRANQGHSIPVVKNLELIQITDPSRFPQVIHGTNLESWRKIEPHGLSRMNRNHIHFAVGRYGDANVTSGMRASCDVFIYVNISKAMEDNIKFFRSANEVILTEGINGILEKKYFLKVIDKYNNVLYGDDDDIDDMNVEGNNVNNKNVDRNNINSKNVDGNNDDIKSTDGNNVNNQNVKGDNDNKVINDARYNTNPKIKNPEGTNVNKGYNTAWDNDNDKIKNPEGTNVNKGNSTAWDNNNDKIKNPGGTNVNKGNSTAWDNNNDKIKNPGGTNDNKGNSNAWNNPRGTNDNKGNNNAWNNPRGTNDNKGNNNAWNNPRSTNDNKGNNNAWNNPRSTNDNKGNNNAWNNPGGTNDNNWNSTARSSNNNKDVDISSVNVNRNNYSNDNKIDNNKRKNDNKDEGKRKFSYADVTKKRQ